MLDTMRSQVLSCVDKVDDRSKYKCFFSLQSAAQTNSGAFDIEAKEMPN